MLKAVCWVGTVQGLIYAFSQLILTDPPPHSTPIYMFYPPKSHAATVLFKTIIYILTYKMI